jgi:H+/gluconate symporter-like permease
MDVLGLLGIIVAIAVLILLVYKGINVIIVGPLSAMIVIIFNNINLVVGYRDYYMGGLGGFVTGQWPIYLWGSVFGVIYQLSGGAASIAGLISKIFRGNKAKAGVFTSILIVIVSGLLMAYGGISGIVLMFVLMPMTLEILKESGIPRKMAPGILLGGLATAGLCMPGSPQQQNVVPMTYLNTPSTAAMIPGFIGGIVVLSLNILFLTHEAKKEIRLGHSDENTLETNGKNESPLPNPLLSLLPLIVTFICFNAFKVYIGYCLIIGICCGIAVFYKQIFNKEAFKTIIDIAVPQAAFLVFASASLSGFGTVVGKTEAFTQLSGALSQIGGPPLLITMFAFMIVTAICGSGPAAMGAGLPIFADTFVSMGVNLSALHRVASFCGTTLDTLPTNAGFIAATGLANKPANESYKYVGVCTVVNTTIATLVVTLLLIFFPYLA